MQLFWLTFGYWVKDNNNNKKGDPKNIGHEF